MAIETTTVEQRGVGNTTEARVTRQITVPVLAVGDVVTCESSWSGPVTGRVEKLIATSGAKVVLDKKSAKLAGRDSVSISQVQVLSVTRGSDSWSR